MAPAYHSGLLAQGERRFPPRILYGFGDTPLAALSQYGFTRAMSILMEKDMRVYVRDREESTAVLALMLADGVTGLRQMTGSPESLAERRVMPEGILPP
jgi:hypothetical protein